ncbi:MAG: stage III sporulation protein AA [Lachnospiraceae bacterium]|nr:stage III sporulation protein AA [Lachnospiraceae bacterium]MDU3180263.1 stage III sporulation protein AA [Lachnospiraceae bacterium]
MKEQKKQILQVLGKKMQQDVEREQFDFSCLQEIRLRTGKPLTVLYKGKEKLLTKVEQEDIRETLEYISNYSLYAYENELRQGFITIEGGHRVGMAGKVVLEEGKIKSLKYISSINIRVAHEVKGCADKIFPYITKERQICHTLIISPPRCGKTTLLRDMIRQISDGNRWVKGVPVGVVDERSELGGCYMGTAQNDLGIRTDILDCCPKADGMLMLIRSMAPQVIAVDEIGAREEICAIEYALHCGCKMLATAHGVSMEEMKKKPFFEQMIREKRFERYIVLGNEHHMGEILGIYDENGERIFENVTI